MPYFRAFSAFSVTATNFMNSITFVMNHLISYFDISICHCSNRTLCYYLFKFHGFNHGYFLGGPRYIHLTKETNAVFPGFFDPLAPAAIIYNSITSVMNYLFLISSDFSDFASLSDPQTLPFFFKWVPSWFYLRRRSLYPFNYENIVRQTYLYRITKIRQNSKSESDWSKIPA